MAENDIVALKQLASGGFLEVALAPADIAAAPANHTHGNLTNAGAIGTTSGLPVKTGTSGVLEAGAFGTAAGQFAEGNHTHTLSAITDAGTAAAQDADQDLGTTDDVTHRSVTVVGDPIEGQEGSFNKGLFSGNALELGPYTDSGPIDEPPYIELTNLGGGVTKVTSSASPDTARLVSLPDASGTLALVETLPAGGSTNLWIPASAWIPRTTGGCGVDSREIGSTNRQNFDELLFDAGTDEFADALVIMPSNYNNGTITARFYWTAASGSGDVIWGIQGRAFANDDALDTAHGTAQTATDTLLAADDMHVSAATSAVTIGGTPAANTPIQFQVYRDADAGGDTLAVDARLLGVEILFN
jgi:hypothetical protein